MSDSPSEFAKRVRKVVGRITSRSKAEPNPILEGTDMSTIDSEYLRAMKEEEKDSRLVALWVSIRNQRCMYVSDLKYHLPESPATPPPPWPATETELESEE